MEGNNIISSDVRDLLSKNPILIMRDKKTLKPLGISYSEDGLRGIANKNGIYLYCEGRVTDFKAAKTAKKSSNVLVERFIPRNFNNKALTTNELHWCIQAKHLINNY